MSPDIKLVMDLAKQVERGEITDDEAVKQIIEGVTPERILAFYDGSDEEFDEADDEDENGFAYDLIESAADVLEL